MRILLVDNHDSYTYNVFHLLAAVSGGEPEVVHNDAVGWRVLSRSGFDAFVLSPGPGRPERRRDFGVCRDILRHSAAPVLGICLGHQGIGALLGGEVASAPRPMHGRLSRIHHLGTGLFAGLPRGFAAVRYHSLAVSGPLGPEGRVVAWADDGVVMGVEHRARPMWGVQFHPESIAAEFGERLARNFLALAERHAPHATQSVPTSAHPPQPPAVDGPKTALYQRFSAHQRGVTRGGGTGWTVLRRTLAGAAPTEPLYERLFGDAETSFWLDSADAPTRLARCSYMGTSAGSGARRLFHDVEAGVTTIHTPAGETRRPGSLFDLLERELADLRVEAPEGVDGGLISGYVGYLGYELKAEGGTPNAHRSDLPDAALMLANRVVAVDHVRGRTHLFALVRSNVDGPKSPDIEDFSAHQHRSAEAGAWLEEAAGLAAAMIREPPPERPPEPAAGAPDPAEPGEPAEPGGRVVFRCGRGRSRYLADIARAQAELAAGESYEVCLTDQIEIDAAPDPLALHRRLRRSNPAPFAALLRFGDLAIVSSSPERFLAIDREGAAATRPIKGTSARAADPATDAERGAALAGDEKTRAEHLMIVDLLRNDLGRVCEVGSVGVPELMAVEPYATVHQLVSTVTGRLRPGRSPLDCVRACFPGGSMTGAPKERTMAIIDALEDEARGVYSGAIGYLGADGAVDLSIAIRAIVIRPGRATVGAGGAIVTQSDPEAEFEEFLLKARAPLAAIAHTLTGRDDGAAWRVELEPRGTAPAPVASLPPRGAGPGAPGPGRLRH